MDALGDGEVDMIYPQPYVSLMDEIDGIGHVESVTGLGPVWEYFGFNQDDPRLQNLFIRQAIAQGINRDAIVEEVVRPITPDGQLLGNSVWLNSSEYYQDHFNGLFPYDPIAAEALLTDNGCVEGDDGIYECDGERLSFSWATTSGNEARDVHFEMAQADLAANRDRDNTEFRADLRAAADEQPAGWGRRLADHEPGLGRLTGPVLGQLPLLLPGQRIERLRRAELLPLLR